MNFPAVIVLASWAAVLSPVHAGLIEPIPTEGGLVSGSAGATAGVRAFQGIPYGAPPVGDLRWRPPAPAQPWTGVLKAERFGMASMQPIRPSNPLMRPPDPPASEDSLYLNVWTPATSAGDKLAVLLWIHGGGNTSGTASMPHYNGERLAAKGVVVVSINYRLGLFGWMAHPELTAESPHKSSGNYALLDMIAALKWVQANIAAFGGDPARVTIWGQSAGASNASALIASPLANGLFSRAILVSGGGLLGGGGPAAAATLAVAEQRGAELGERVGARSLAALRALPAERLRNERYQAGSITDGWVLPESVAVRVRQGRNNLVGILIGSTADDAPRLAPGLEKYKEQNTRTYGDRAAEFFLTYPATTDAQAKAAHGRFAGDRAAVNSRNRLEVEYGLGNRNLYLFYFSRIPPLPANPNVVAGSSESLNLGSYHGAELVYAFGTLKTRAWPWTPRDFTLSEEMMTYWTQFAKDGTTQAVGIPDWPAWTPEGDARMVFGEESAVRRMPSTPGLKFASEWMQPRDPKSGSNPAAARRSGDATDGQRPVR